MTTPKEALELKPCPFCGATPHRGLGKTWRDQLHGDPHQDTWIGCPKGHAKIAHVNAEYAVNEWNTRATASLEGDAVERMARIIDPDAWRYVDDATRPYAENRGSSNGNGGESYWYERTRRAGCRSVNDVKQWLFERTLATADPIHITHIRESVIKARRILATGLVPDEAAIRADERERLWKLAVDLTLKWGNPNGTQYEQGVQDHGHRLAAAIRSNRREA